MKTIIKSAIVLFAIVLTILSCSKKDDEVTAPLAESYTVPVEITFNGETHTSSIDVLVPDISINPCKTVWAIAEQKVGKFGFVIGNFNPAGGAIDKIVDPAGCAKMKFEGKLSQPNVGENVYSINTVGEGTIAIVGKTYTMTCVVYRTINPINVKAVWTKP